MRGVTSPRGPGAVALALLLVERARLDLGLALLLLLSDAQSLAAGLFLNLRDQLGLDLSLKGIDRR
eukprot:15484166-Alexandrium_andersonii.AAC.1